MSKVNYIMMGTPEVNCIIVNYQHKTVPVKTGDHRFAPILKCIQESKTNPDRLNDIVSLMSPADALAKKGLQLVNGSVHIDGQELPESLDKRLRVLIETGMPVELLVRFWNNLKENPSFNSRQMLYKFLEHNGHPLTEDGCFIAYRGIREDFKDKHTGTMDNSPGQIIAVDRASVDDNPNNTCSHGLHVAAFTYAKSFGPKLIEVKVNPRDVVAVPTDYNGTKMRVCKFEVLAECAAIIEGPVYKPETLKKDEPAPAPKTKQHSLRGPGGRFVAKPEPVQVLIHNPDFDDDTTDDVDGEDDEYYDSY